MKEPACPYCYDGTIKTDGIGVYFCCKCFAQVEIKKMGDYKCL